MTINRYVLEDPNGHQHEEIFIKIEDAREAAAEETAVAIISLQFKYSDSELVEVWRHGVKTDEERWPA